MPPAVAPTIRGEVQTVREWQRQGLLSPAERFPSLRARDQALISAMVKEVEEGNSSFVFGLGAELDSMVTVLREYEIDQLSPRGRRLLFRAWKQFESWGFDFEKWNKCRKCGAQFMPVRDRHFTDAFGAITESRG